MTPEEKLLRIIESPGTGPRNLPRARMNAASGGLFLKAWITHHRVQFTKKISLKAATQVVVVLCVAATIYFVLDFLIGMPNVTLIERVEKAAKKMNLGNISVGALSPLSLYLQEVGQNNIFSLPEPSASSSTAATAQAEASATLRNMVQTLRVVGIIWSDIPQVIVEDTKEGRTYSLNRGSRFKDVMVKEILRDRVILSYDNQEIELR